VFNVSYHSDIEQVKQALSDLLVSDARILIDPAPRIFVQELGEDGMQIAARPWVKVDDYWDVQWDMPERVKRRFDAEGIGIPFPQREVRLLGNT
jgi:small conductance mechanosensitive channel